MCLDDNTLPYFLYVNYKGYRKYRNLMRWFKYSEKSLETLLPFIHSDIAFIVKINIKIPTIVRARLDHPMHL